MLSTARTALLVLAACLGVAVANQESDLRKQLFKDYDKDSLPQMQTNLNISFTIRNIDIDEDQQAMILDTWVRMTWNDSRLQWNKSDFEPLDHITVSAKDMWMPDISLYNNARMETFHYFTDTLVLVYPTGKVLQVPTARMPASCSLDMTYWPQDVHNCSIKFGSWVHSGLRLNLQPFGEPDKIIEFEFPEETPDDRQLTRTGWEVLSSKAAIVSKYYDCCPEPYMSVDMDIIVKRFAPAYCWMTKLPAIGLSLLTVVLFLMPPGATEKVVVGAILIMINTIFLCFSRDVVKNSASKTPLLVKFVSEQLMLTLLCVITSVIVVRIVKDPHRGGLPAWLQKFISCEARWLGLGGYSSLVDQSETKQYPPMKDNCDDRMVMVTGCMTNSYSSEWLLLGAVLDRLFLVAYLSIFALRLSCYSAIW